MDNTTEPVVNAFDTNVGIDDSIFALNLFNSVDPDEGHFISLFEFQDLGFEGGFFALDDGVPLDPFEFHAFTPDEIFGLQYFGDDIESSETFAVRVTDSADNVSNTDFAIINTVDADSFTDPLVTALPTAAPLNTSIGLLDMIRVDDPDTGSSVATFQVRDNSAGAGAFFLNGVELAPNVFHDVTAFQLPTLSYETASEISSETFSVRVIDGAGNISNTSTSTVTSGNSSSVVTGTDGRVLPLEIVSLADFISVTDIDGDNPVTIGILDRNNGPGSGNFEVRGEILPQAQFAFFAFNELDDILYRGGSTPGSEDITVIVFDGSSFSEEATFTLTTSSPPVITSNNLTVLENEPVLASSLITFSDVDGDTAVAYNIIDRRINEDGGFFQLDGVRLESGQFFNVNAAEFARLQYVGASNGPQAENLAFHVFDTGGQWSELTDITVNTVTLPTVQASDFSIQRGQFVNIATGGISNVSGAQAAGTPFLNFFDADGDEIEQILLLDRQLNDNGGHFLLDGVRLPSASFFSVTPDQLINLEYRGGEFGPQTENLTAIAFSNGGQSSEQVDFQIFTLPNQFAPEVDFFNASGRLGTSIALSTLVNVTDQDGDLPTSFSFFDTGDSADGGFFTDNGVVIEARQFQTFQFSQIGDIRYNFGSVGGSEVVRLVVNDGRSSSQLVSATLTSLDTPELEAIGNSIQVDTIERVDVSSLIVQTDSGPAFTQYEIFDENADAISGRFELNGVSLQQGVLQTITAADFQNLVFLGAESDLGRSLDPILIRATNGVTGFTEFERINVTTDPVGADALDSGGFFLDGASTTGTTVFTYTFVDGNPGGSGDNRPQVPSYYVCAPPPEGEMASVVCDTPNEALGLNASQRDTVRDVLAGFENVTNVEFVEVAYTPDAADAAITFGAAEIPGASSLFNPPTPDADGNVPDVTDALGSELGDIWFNRLSGSDNFDPLDDMLDTGPGSRFRAVAVEIVALTLGLGNPRGVLPNALEFNFNTALTQEDDNIFNPLSGLSGIGQEPSTLQLFDIEQLQTLYGVNTTFNDGNNQYGNFFSGSEAHFVDNDTTILTTLFDAGGIDTYNFTNHVDDETIDLRQGTFTSVNGIDLALRTSYGTIIENARGGSGDDSIRGNEIRNFLIGNDGNDVLRGGGGNDVLRGIGGNDTFIWALGDGRDVIQEEGGGGVDVLEILDPSGVLDSLEDDLTFRRLGDDLRIDLTFDQQPGLGSITIQDFVDPNSQVELLRLVDSSGNQIGGDIDLVSIFDQATSVGTRFEVTGAQNVFQGFTAFAASPV